MTIDQQVEIAIREYAAERSRDRRKRLRAAHVCINATSHGAPEPGKTKCTRCLEQHRKSNRREP